MDLKIEMLGFWISRACEVIMLFQLSSQNGKVDGMVANAKRRNTFVTLTLFKICASKTINMVSRHFHMWQGM